MALFEVEIREAHRAVEISAGNHARRESRTLHGQVDADDKIQAVLRVVEEWHETYGEPLSASTRPTSSRSRS